MRFHEAANTLFALRRFGTRAGTDSTAALLAHLDDPQAGLPCVQIAGSNGKGSTARMLSSILREAELSVGLYTSPHLDSVRERVQVDGRPLREAALVSFVEAIEGYITDRAAAGDPPTFFETLTALALWEFDRQNVDVAVLEVGIGGRYDATSVVDPVGAAVTSVTLEHTGVLGDDVETIGRDMASVAPVDRPLVTAVTGDTLGAVRERAGEVLTVGPDGAENPDLRVAYGGREAVEGRAAIEGDTGTGQVALETRLALLGSHQAENAGVAVALARQVRDALDTTVTDGALERGLRTAHWPGRFEIVGRDPLVVLDGAHNPAACARLADTLAEFDHDRLHLVVGALTDKNHREMMAALPEASHTTVCEPANDRAERPDVLAAALESETDGRVSTRADVAGAVADALDRAAPGDCVLVTGSLYTVGEARTRWTRTTTATQPASESAGRGVLDAAHVPETEIRELGGSTVHRVVRMRVQPRQAEALRAAFRAVGGEVAVSGLSAAENKQVALMGTVGQFRAVCTRLDNRGHGLAPLADEVRAATGIGDREGRYRGSLLAGADTDETGGAGHGAEEYPWTSGTSVMGILNVTPDSFHDGGEYEARTDAVERAEEMVAAGADIVDIGGESTRPGADPVPVPEECERVLPVVSALADLDVLVSIDTRKAAVARAALDAGADILNDVSGLADPEMRLVAAEYDVPVVVMHSISAPVDPDTTVEYDDVVDDVLDALADRVLLAEQVGLDRSQVIVDPGLGFGKSAAESFELLARVDEFHALGCPVLLGHSHKSMFGQVDRAAGERREATVAATAIAAERGADIVRVHDVEPNVAAVDVAGATRDADNGRR
jgi:dihydropteroate synthase